MEKTVLIWVRLLSGSTKLTRCGLLQVLYTKTAGICVVNQALSSSFSDLVFLFGTVSLSTSATLLLPLSPLIPTFHSIVPFFHLSFFCQAIHLPYIAPELLTGSLLAPHHCVSRYTTSDILFHCNSSIAVFRLFKLMIFQQSHSHIRFTCKHSFGPAFNTAERPTPCSL